LLSACREKIGVSPVAIGMSDDKAVFKRVDMDFSSLLRYVDHSDIGLPGEAEGTGLPDNAKAIAESDVYVKSANDKTVTGRPRHDD